MPPNLFLVDEKGTLIADEKLIYQLNELRLTSVGEY
jgi:hypothetical protein